MGTGSTTRRWTKIQTDRVLIRILARGLLTLSEVRVSLWIMARSWGEGSPSDPRPKTGPEIVSSEIADDIGMDGGQVRRTLKTLIQDNIIIRYADGSLEFNEHVETWTRDESSQLSRDKSSQHGVSNRHSKACQIVTLERDESSHQTGQIVTANVTNRHGSYIFTQTPQIPRERSGAQKTRAPTAAEKTFLEGFKNRYGHACEIGKGHAIRLNQLSQAHGTETVVAKINAWWSSGAGKWADDRGTTRDIAAFLTSFDRIDISGNRTPGATVSPADKARFDAATKT